MTKGKVKIECRTYSHGCDNFCRVIGFILFVRPSSVLVTKWTRTSTVILHRLSASFCVSSLPFTFMRCRNVVFSNMDKFYGTNKKKREFYVVLAIALALVVCILRRMSIKALLHCAIFRATCLATQSRDKSHETLHNVSKG